MPSKFKSKHKKQADGAAAATPAAASSSSASSSSSSAANGQSAANGAVSSIEQLKDKGNAAFTTGNFQRALELYTAAIDEAAAATTAASSSSSSSSSSSTAASSAPSSVAHPPFPTHTLYSNRSATQLALKNYSAALSDADAAIILAPQWPKGYLRKGAALEQLLRYHDAHTAYQQGIKLDPSDTALVKSHTQLTLLLDELKISQDELTQHATNPDSDRFTTMCNWLRTGGSQFPKLYLQYYSEDYRGVHALTRVPSDDIILYVPYNLIMTSQVAMESEIGKQIIAAKVDLRSKHSYLASYLLQEKEKNGDSYWTPYLACLPAYYNNMPIFFPPPLLAMLKGSFTLQKIQDRIDSLRTEYDNIKASVPSFARFSHDDFVWARLVVITRIFGLVINGVKTDGLVPYADMLNHKKPKDAMDTDTKWTYDDHLNGFTIISLKSIARGEQVYDSYGRKCNSRFFVNYGFALSDNEDDNEAVLRFTPSPASDPFYHTKLNMLTASTTTLSREFQVPATYRETSDREKKTKEMFSWLRFVVAVDSELMMLPQGEGGRVKVEEVEVVSVRNESAVLRMVKAAAEEALKAFETTLEADDELIRTAAYPEYSNERNIILMRRGEKQVLRWYVRLAEVCLDLLSKPWSVVKKATAKSLQQSHIPLDHYIVSVIIPLVKKS